MTATRRPRKLLRRIRYTVRSRLSVYPSLYLPFARRKYRHQPTMVLGPGADVVIEGFQRSGNTFAVVAFETAQPNFVRTVHHLHAAAQVIAAVRMGLPTLVLIRDPEESVMSHMIREPAISARQGLANWVRFYETVSSHRRGFVVGEFRTVVEDFGTVVRAMNERFGTSFAEFQHTEENVARCFELIEERNRSRYGTIVESLVARPSGQREDVKPALRRQLQDPALSSLRDRAYRVYHVLSPASAAT